MRRAFIFLAAILGPAIPIATAQKAEPRPRLEFNRMVAHWTDYADPDYLTFLSEARPEIAQVGFYGAHFYSLAHTPQYKGYPAHFPVMGLDECGKFFTNLNAEVHKRGIKVVGHFNVEFLVGDPDSPKGPRGFFKFYRELWDEKAFGPRPVKDPLELLEKNADGTPIVSNSYSIGDMKEYWGCLNNPHWRTVLKAWVKVGIARGVDGFVANYFYRHNCLCQHCQASFRKHLSERYSAKELRDNFGINDVGKHVFTEIVGWHAPKESTPLRREMLRFSQISTKMAFDDVFVKYGRSLKPDLILAQWNHLGNFSQINGDERCMLPADLWGKDEDYAWYSTGGAAFFTDLEEGILGEGTLQARYIRGAFDKPFTLGKYETTRTRVYIAELAANGGAPLGFYARFKDPLARKEIVRYFNFLEKHADLFRGNRPHAEVVLLFPRTRVQQHADVESVETFKKLGKELLDRHVLFDILPDDLATKERLAAYTSVVTVADVVKPAMTLSQFQAPVTVRVSASRPKKASDLLLHFVNYNREEPAKKRSAGSGIADEKPIAVKGIAADVKLPENFHAAKVTFLTPEESDPVAIPFKQEGGRLRFQVPQFLVYAVIRLEVTP